MIVCPGGCHDDRISEFSEFKKNVPFCLPDESSGIVSGYSSFAGFCGKITIISKTNASKVAEAE